MRPSRTRKLATAAAAIALLACGWYLFAPPSLGGHTSYVVTDGVSMQPRFHSGDLAVVRSRSDYHVGEIVAYHNKTLHTVVLHRIIAIDGGRYVFKGDHNNFIDFEHPARSQLIGSLWLHLPGAGAQLDSVRSPLLIGALVAFAALAFMGAAFVRTRRRRGRERRAEAGAHMNSHAQRSVLSADDGRVVAAIAIGAIAMIPFLVLGVLAFSRPASSLAPVKVPYAQSGTLTYSASAPAGPAYPSGAVRTGDPIFTRVLGGVAFHYRYRFHAPASHSLAGRASLVASVASTSGWQTTLRLGSPQFFRGEEVTVGGTLDATALNQLLARLEATTAVPTNYTMTVTGRVSVGGSLGTVPVHSVFTSDVPFVVNHEEIRPLVANGQGSSAVGGRPPASFFVKSQAAAATGRSLRPATMKVGPVTMTVATARAIAIAAILLIAAMLALSIRLLRPRRGTEAEAIRARYGPLIVPVARVGQQPGVPVIDVEHIDALVRIAEHYERSILCERTPQGEAFWVTDESGQFRYQAGLLAPQAAQPGEATWRNGDSPAVTDAEYALAAAWTAAPEQESWTPPTLEQPAAAAAHPVPGEAWGEPSAVQPAAWGEPAEADGAIFDQGPAAAAPAAWGEPNDATFDQEPAAVQPAAWSEPAEAAGATFEQEPAAAPPAAWGEPAPAEDAWTQPAGADGGTFDPEPAPQPAPWGEPAPAPALPESAAQTWQPAVGARWQQPAPAEPAFGAEQSLAASHYVQGPEPVVPPPRPAGPSEPAPASGAPLAPAASAAPQQQVPPAARPGPHTYAGRRTGP